MYRDSDNHFLEHPYAREQKGDNGQLKKVNCSLWVKVPFLLSAQSFDFWTFCEMTSLRVSFIIEFLAREAFPGC